MTDLVSIIVPCYNAEKYIVRALNSVEYQTYKNLEVICIDDGSLDNTLHILKEHKKTFKFMMQIIAEENSGVSVARNRGIESAHGSFLLFLDADDCYAPEYVEKLVNEIKQNNADTSYVHWSHDKNEVMNQGKSQGQTKSQLELMKHFMYRPTPISFLNFLYRKATLDKYQIRFAEGIKYGEDNLFFWQYLCHVNTAIYINRAMYWYFENENSVMHNPSWEIVNGVEAIYCVLDYMKSVNFKYVTEFQEYMPVRTKFSIAKEFARYGQKEFFKKFVQEYNLQKEVKNLVGKNGIALSISAYIMKTNPMTFYNLVKMVYYKKGLK